MAKLIKVWDGTQWQNVAPAVPNALSTDGIQTLTNKTISGASNTLTNIPNSALTNSSITINGSAVSLGGSVSLPGDIESVTASSPLTGGGTSGAVTIGIQSASTSQSGAVQLTDSTSSTSTTTAATPNSVKTAYDLANGSIQKTLTSTIGDIIYASAANTPARLGIGSSGQVLSVIGGIPAWSSPSSAITLISSTASTSAAVSISNIPQTYKTLLCIVRGSYNGSTGIQMTLGRTNNPTAYQYTYMGYSGNTATLVNQSGAIPLGTNGLSTSGTCYATVWIPSYASNLNNHMAYSIGVGGRGYDFTISGGYVAGGMGPGIINSLYFSSGQFSSFTVDLYGVS